MTNYNDGKWHGWNGGDCPVHPETIVECYGGENVSGKVRSRAKFRKWCDIEVFRVIKEHREPREWWLVNVGGGFLEVNHSGECGGIHVREVLQ